MRSRPQRDLARLRAAIAALPPHYRDVLVLVELAERSYAEAAAICGCELNTVRSRLFRARALARTLARRRRRPRKHRPRMTMVPPPLPTSTDTSQRSRTAVADALPPAGHRPRHRRRRCARAALAARARSRVRNGDRWLAWPLALAASIALLSFVVRSLPPEAIVAEPAPASLRGRRRVPAGRSARRHRAGAATPWSCPARLPRTTLAQLGLPINPARAADAIDAELLVRRDGSVLAVRFVY